MFETQDSLCAVTTVDLGGLSKCVEVESVDVVAQHAVSSRPFVQTFSNDVAEIFCLLGCSLRRVGSQNGAQLDVKSAHCLDDVVLKTVVPYQTIGGHESRLVPPFCPPVEVRRLVSSWDETVSLLDIERMSV